jgi:hypothetical protein
LSRCLILIVARHSREEAQALIVDCTEQPIQRPRADAVQRGHYSGKKKQHSKRPVSPAASIA